MFDRNTIIGIILIFIIFVGWSYFFQPKPTPRTPATTPADTTQVTPPGTDTSLAAVTKTRQPFMDSLVAMPDSVPAKEIVVETKLYRAVLTSKGAGISRLTFKEYRYSDSGNVEMLPPDGPPVPTVMSNVTGFSDTGIGYNTSGTDANLSSPGASQTINFVAQIPGKGEISKEFTFYADRYDFDLVVRINGVPQLGLDREYIIAWLPGIPPSENNLHNDFSSYLGGAHVGGEMRKFDSFEEGKIVADVSGTTTWVGSRSRYFAFAIYPKEGSGEGAYIRGAERARTGADGNYNERQISAGIVMASGVNTAIEKDFTVFVGPLDYKILKTYKHDLEDFIGWGWVIIKPFSHAIYWVTYQLHHIIPNYGVVIIVIAILLKVVTYPLTRKSLKSMAAMRDLAPKMEELKAKYKNDPQKLNSSMMKLYKEEGVNPVGGCLLMLPQLPLLYGLYTVFNSTIEFRQAYFLPLWPDLSIPDPFPYILPIVMAIAMFFQQKMSLTDPKMKLTVYLMPVIFFFFMKSAPVGLVLYWTVYSVLSIFEQIYIKRGSVPMNPQVK